VGGQYYEARLLLGQSENPARALGEPPPVAHTGNPALLEDLRPVGEVPDQEQRRPVGTRTNSDTDPAV